MQINREPTPWQSGVQVIPTQVVQPLDRGFVEIHTRPYSRIETTTPPATFGYVPSQAFIDTYNSHFPFDGYPEELRGILSDSTNVMYDGATPYEAIGDHIIRLRYLFALARARGDKPVTIALQPRVLNLAPYFDTPPNVTFTDTSPCRETENVMRLFRRQHEYMPIEELMKLEGEAFLDVDQYNYPDMQAYLYLRLAGFELGYGEVIRSPFKFSPDSLPRRPTHDLVLAPDAQFYGQHVEEDTGVARSVKSLQTKQWGDVFSSMRAMGFNGRIAIVGSKTVHGEYLAKVESRARENGIRARYVETPTLSDLVQMILNSKKYIGMDSGPSHIAAAAIEAARQHGNATQFRQIFNGRAVEFDTWRIMYEHLNGKILVYRGTYAPHPHDPDDMVQLRPREIADFILTEA